MADKSSAMLETVIGKLVVFDVCFVRGAKASRTLLVTTDNGVHVYVDIDAERSPVAVTLIHRTGVDLIQYDRVPEEEPEPSYQELSALADNVVTLDSEGALLESRNSLPIPRTIGTAMRCLAVCNDAQYRVAVDDAPGFSAHPLFSHPSPRRWATASWGGFRRQLSAATAEVQFRRRRP